MSHDPCGGAFFYPFSTSVVVSGKPMKGDSSIQVQDENYVMTHCWPSRRSALLLVLYFGSGPAGREDGPLIGIDASTLSAYGARNSTELLPNLCSMFGI